MPSLPKLFPFAIVALLFAVSPVFAQKLALADIIDAHIKALGGKEAISKVDNVERKATVSLESGFGTMSGTVEEITDVNGKRYYNNLDLGQFKKTETMSGDVGSVKGTEGDRDMTADEVDFAKMNLSVCPLLAAYKTAKGTLKLKETIQFNGKQCHVIAMGPGVEFFVNTKTHLLDGMKLESFVAIAMSDYESVGGVKLHRKREITTASEGVKINFQFTSSKTNIEIDDSLFGDLVESNEPDKPEYTAEQIIGFMDKDDDEKISEDEAGGLIKENFGAIDTNGDGFIDMNETDAMLIYSAQQKAKEKVKPKSKSVSTTSNQIIASMDRNKDGRIAKDEADEELKPFFSTYDTNKDNFIDEKEGQAIADFVSGR